MWDKASPGSSFGEREGLWFDVRSGVYDAGRAGATPGNTVRDVRDRDRTICGKVG